MDEAPRADIGLDPQLVTFDLYCALTPHNLDLDEGNLCDGEQQRLNLLQLLLYNVGLRRAVRLAPRALWEEAIRGLGADG